MGLLLMLVSIAVYAMFVYPLIRNFANWAGYLNDEWQVSVIRAVVISFMVSLAMPYRSAADLLINLAMLFVIDVLVHRYQPNRSP